jgi:myo-inositol-1(or 4)-monophosphatase
MNENYKNHWNQVLIHAIRAARLGRKVLLDHFGKLKHIEKKFQAGLVSEADREAEEVIKNYLADQFPQDEFLGEESFQESQLSETSRNRWIVDPLDGTTNYIHGFPVFCVSIGYQFENELQVAVIDMPLLQETYTSIKGLGAYVNGEKMHVSSAPSVRDSLLATGFFGENEEQLQEQMRIFPHVVQASRGVRRAGAAAYDLAQVARGVFDAFWEKGLKPWDAAAGILLVQEAGGVNLTYRGKTNPLYQNSLISGSPKVVAELLQIFKNRISADTD